MIIIIIVYVYVLATSWVLGKVRQRLLKILKNRVTHFLFYDFFFLASLVGKVVVLANNIDQARKRSDSPSMEFFFRGKWMCFERTSESSSKRSSLLQRKWMTASGCCFFYNNVKYQLFPGVNSITLSMRTVKKPLWWSPKEGRHSVLCKNINWRYPPRERWGCYRSRV